MKTTVGRRKSAGRPSPHSFVILNSKIRPPLGGSSSVSRSRLLPDPNELPETRLILLNAPAGYGKTTLLRQYHQWLQEQGFATVWLRFDAADNEKTRALAYLAAAFSEVEPDLDVGLAPIFSALPPLSKEDILAALLAELEESEKEFFLLIDDYHTIVDDEVHAAIAYFLVNLPRNIRCVTASRTTPPWPLSEISHNGKVRCFDEKDICFNTHEIAEYLSSEHNVALDDDNLNAILAQTEGWITAIKLAALSFESQNSNFLPEKAISGAQQALVNYLAESVFAKQDEETQEFLLLTAPLERLCPSLCDAVTGANSATAMIEKLQREKLFLEPLDAPGSWYRYHSLFSEFLLGRLDMHPTLIRANIHRKASYWFEVNKQPREAAEHALAAGDDARKEALIEAAIYDMVRASQVALAIEWFERLPESFSTNKPNVLIPLAWSYINSRRTAAARDILGRARRLVTENADLMKPADQESIDEFLVEIEIAEIHLYRVSEDRLHPLKELQALRTKLKPTWHFIRAMVELEICYVHTEADDLEPAFAAASECLLYAKKAPNPFVANIAAERQAWIRYLQGRLSDAQQYCSYAIGKALDKGGEPLPVAGHFHLLAADINYELNDLEQSRSHLEEAIRLTAPNESPDIRSETEILAAKHLAVECGGQAAAERLIRHNNRHLDESSPHSVDRVRSFQAWFLVGCGNLAAAEALLRRLSAPLDRTSPPANFAVNSMTEMRYLAMCRYLTASGEAERSTYWLRHLLRLAERSGRSRSLVLINGLLALAQAARDQEDSALRYVREMLLVSEQCRAARPIVDLGIDLAVLLKAYIQRLTDEPDSDRANRIAYIESLLDIAKGAGAPIAAGDSESLSPLSFANETAEGDNQLTKRELQILELISVGSKNRDVAAELLISETTVRWHVRNLYSKLGVHNRTQASAKARSLKLIH